MKRDKKQSFEIETFFTLLKEINNIEKSNKQKNKEINRLVYNKIINYPKITEKIIKEANSSKYTFCQSIKSLDIAYYILGLQEIKNIIICETIYDIFYHIISSLNNSQETEILIQKSLFSGMLINEISKRLDIGSDKELRLFGLISNIIDIFKLQEIKIKNSNEKNLDLIKKFNLPPLLYSLFKSVKSNIHKNPEESIAITSLKISNFLFSENEMALNKLTLNLPFNFSKNDLIDILEKIELDTLILIPNFSKYHKNIQDKIQNGIKILNRNKEIYNEDYLAKTEQIVKDITYITKYLNYTNSPIESLLSIEKYFEYNNEKAEIIFFEETKNDLLEALFKKDYTIDKNDKEKESNNIFLPIKLKDKRFYLCYKSKEKEKTIAYLNLLTKIIENSFKQNIRLHTIKNGIIYVPSFNSQYTKDLGDENIDIFKNLILSDISSLIFHRLKNKLTPILGYIQMLEKKIESQQYQEKLEKIKNSSYQLSDILTILRDYMEAKFTYKYKNIQEFNLNQTIIEALNFFKGKYEVTDTLITTKLDLEIPLSLFNKGEIILAINELLDNSYKAVLSNKTKKIQIKTFKTDKNLGFEILDNGQGIEDIEKALTPSYKKENTGFGLSLCKLIIKKHEGNISLKSEKGKYTAVSITLPIKKSISFQEILKNHILLISDTEILERILIKIFGEDINITPLKVNNYQEAVNLLSRENNKEFFIISDLSPSLDTENFINLAKKQEMILILDKYEKKQIQQIMTIHDIKPLYKPIRLNNLKKIVSDKLINIRRKNG